MRRCGEATGGDPRALRLGVPPAPAPPHIHVIWGPREVLVRGWGGGVIICFICFQRRLNSLLSVLLARVCEAPTPAAPSSPSGPPAPTRPPRLAPPSPTRLTLPACWPRWPAWPTSGGASSSSWPGGLLGSLHLPRCSSSGFDPPPVSWPPPDPDNIIASWTLAATPTTTGTDGVLLKQRAGISVLTNSRIDPSSTL